MSDHGCLALAFVAPFLAAAQHTPADPALLDPCPDFDPENTIEWPSDPALGDASGFGRLVLADLDGDPDPDAVVLAGGLAAVLRGVAHEHAPEPVLYPNAPTSLHVGDVACLPDGGPQGSDALLLTEARGLLLLTWQAGSLFDPELLAAGPWREVDRLEVVDLDGDGDLDVLGLTAGRHVVVSLLRGAGGFAPGPGWIEAETLLAVVPIDWEEGGARELALLTEQGLIVRDLAGDPVDGFPWPASAGRLARLRAPDAVGGELLAWTRPSPSGGSEVVLAAKGRFAGPWPLAFTLCGNPLVIEPVELVAGPHDPVVGDGLLLVHAANRTAVYTRGLAGRLDAPTPAPLAREILPLAADFLAAGGSGIPAFGPSKEGATHELVYPVAATGNVEVFGPPKQRARTFAGGSGLGLDLALPVTEFGPDAGGVNRLRLAFEVPESCRHLPFLDLVLWRQDPPTGTTPVTPVAVSHRRHPLLQSGGGVWPAAQWVEVEYDFPHYDSLTGPCWSNPRPIFFLEYRFVRVLPSGALKASPTQRGAFTVAPCDAPAGYGALIQQGFGPGFELYEHNGLTSPGPELARDVVGLYVPMSSRPPFEAGVIPDPTPALAGAFALPVGEN